jgi:hypothetical protein
MPLRILGHGIAERDAPSPSSSSYVATPAMVNGVLAWYREPEPHYERPGQEWPDGWKVVDRSTRGDKEVLLLAETITEACVEVVFRRDGVEFADVDARPLPPDEAYERMMDFDETVWARGHKTYNARHPKP